MRSGFAAVFAILVGGAALVAQGSGPSSVGVAGMEGDATSTGQFVFDACRVSMRAQHLSDGSMVKTHSGHPNSVGQWLHLTMVGHDSKQIARATLTVRGSSPKGRVADADNSNSEPFNAVRTMTIAFAAGADGSASADVWVPGMTAVQRIDLKSVVYSDGSTWEIGSDASCHIAPDPFMLIGNR
jgi:hypothetical protein